jgi:hypothetical protein
MNVKSVTSLLFSWIIIAGAQDTFAPATMAPVTAIPDVIAVVPSAAPVMGKMVSKKVMSPTKAEKISKKPVMKGMTTEIPAMKGMPTEIPAMKGMPTEIPAMKGMTTEIPAMKTMSTEKPAKKAKTGTQKGKTTVKPEKPMKRN